MVSLAIKKKKYTYQDYLKTPEDKIYELVDGELLMTPAPKIWHQRISRKLTTKMVNFVEDNDLGEIFNAPCDVYFDEENTVQPDIFFISKAKSGIVTEDNIQGAPDIVVEILSSASVYRDTIQKKNIYARFGVLEYWIAAPLEKMIEVHFLKDDQYQLTRTYFYNDTLESQVLSGFQVNLKEIF